MQVDRLAVELRQRNGFESLDLGFAMYRRVGRALLRAWLVTYVPTALVGLPRAVGIPDDRIRSSCGG